MNYTYHDGSCIIKVGDEEGRVRIISKYPEESDKPTELHIINDPFPEISIQDLIDEDGDFTIIKDTILEQITEDDYERLQKKANRSKTF